MRKAISHWAERTLENLCIDRLLVFRDDLNHMRSHLFETARYFLTTDEIHKLHSQITDVIVTMGKVYDRRNEQWNDDANITGVSTNGRSSELGSESLGSNPSTPSVKEEIGR